MSNLNIFCALLVISFTCNIFLLHISQNTFTAEQCLKLGFNYLNNHLTTDEKTDTTTHRTTTNVASVVNTRSTSSTKVIETKKHQHTWNDSVLSDKFVKHCITDAILGEVPNNTQTLKFTAGKQFNIESASDRALSFQKVFNDRAWGKDWDGKDRVLSASGRGSTLYWAQDVIGVLHKVINDIKILKGRNYRVKMLDVPCGDFVWMSRFLSSRDDIDYKGVDLVPELIEHHKKNYKHEAWTFMLGDVVEGNMVDDHYDIILCRMLFQHLLSNDVKKILKAFSTNSGGLLITTTFSESSTNEELKLNDLENPGRFREVNLEIPPYSLPPPICYSRDGMPGERMSPNIYLGIWSLPLRRVRRCITSRSFQVKGFNACFNSCVKWTRF